MHTGINDMVIQESYCRENRAIRLYISTLNDSVSMM